MKRNIIAIVAYSVVFCLYIIFSSIATEIFKTTSNVPILKYLSLIISFLLSSIASALIANKNPVRYAVLGSLFFLTLIICFAPFVTRLLFTPIGPTSQKLLLTIPQGNFHLIPFTLQILSIMILPVVILLALIGGFMGGKLKNYFKKE